ncbi:DUF6573 family protein [Streptomyces sp. NPDC021100]|uniref:DUF6573 family protein n=1 Tax=Streptomyces sp. NPDC021100 TaxID=3365114 RepID=UPI0037BBB7C7
MTDKSLIDGATHFDDTVSDDAMRWTRTPEPEPEASAASLTEVFGDPIHVYTRAQAFADGYLRAVPEGLWRETRFSVPVALTAAAWEDCVAWTDADSDRQVPQDEIGRLWDVLSMTRWAIGRNRNGSRVDVELYRVPRGGRARTARHVRLVAEIGPGDNGEPVLTIRQPDED